MKKFAIVSTWNGEGYSYQNKLEMIIGVKSFEAAVRITRALAYQENAGMDNFEIIKNGVCFTTRDEDDKNVDAGTYQVFELDETSYGILIHPEINDAVVLTKEEYDEEFERALEQADPEDYEEGDLFIHACKEDLSFQFIVL